MTVERVLHSGAYVISAIVGGYLESRTYYGYTRAEALAEWRAERRASRA